MRKLMKFISVLCMISLISGCGLVTKTEKPEEKETEKKSETVVTVGDTKYSMERFNLYFYNAQDEILKGAGYQQAADIPADFWEQEVDGVSNLQRAKDSALAMLTDDALAKQKAVEYGIELNSEEKSAISNQISSLKQDKVSLTQFEYIGISVDELEDYYVDMFHIQHLIPKLIEKGEIKVDDAKVKSEFESSYVKAQHILLNTTDSATGQPLSDDKIAAATKKAEEILKQINAGADFDELMNKHCEDPGVAANPDGYVFTTGEMVPEFEEAAFNLAVGEVSGLVNTSYGIHIIKRVPFDYNGAQETQIMEALESQVAYPEFQTLLKTWKSKADIKTNDKVLSKVKASITNSTQE